MSGRGRVGRITIAGNPTTGSSPLAKAELRRDMAGLRFIEDQIKEIEQERMVRLDEANPGEERANGMVRLLTRGGGAGVETADMLTHAIFIRGLRDRRAVARYAGLTGSADESGSKRRERGPSRAGNPRVRRGMVQLAWRFLVFQKDCALVRWFRARAAEVGGRRRMSLIVAFARKLLIALRRLAMGRGAVPRAAHKLPSNSWIVGTWFKAICSAASPSPRRDCLNHESLLMQYLIEPRHQSRKPPHRHVRIRNERLR